jgi:L-lactate utilization protein LutC
VKLTSETKEYISRRVRQLVAKLPNESRLEAVKEEANSVAVELSNKLAKMIAEATDEFVKKYPDAKGIQFVSDYGNRVLPEVRFCKLAKDLDKELASKCDTVDITIAMAQITASKYNDVMELDDAIVELVNRQLGRVVVPSSCAGHTTTP